ncbi:hypothetical protein HYU15_02705, partial [Candidatus Woesearchaeota archaeon]|nr:hypothetical protein [Candidatus Woesearchaeota archaeon]
PVPVYDLSVPGPENFLSCQGFILHNSGHPSLSTFHAASVETVIRRLETPPINLPASLVDSLDIVCSVVHIKDQRRNTRRVKDLKEVIEVKQQLGEADTHTLFEWNPIADKLIYHSNSYLLQLISKKTGIPVKELERELGIRAEILRKMQEQGILSHEEVTGIINQYYKDPETVMKRFGITGQATIRPEEVTEKLAAKQETQQAAKVPIAKVKNAATATSPTGAYGRKRK